MNDEDGGATVEYVLWLPMMASGLALTTDVALLMNTQSSLFVAARDASRQVALGQKTPTQAQTETEDRLSSNGAYDVKIEEVNGFVTSKISVQFSEVTVFSGMFSGETDLTSAVTMLIEKNQDEFSDR